VGKIKFHHFWPSKEKSFWLLLEKPLLPLGGKNPSDTHGSLLIEVALSTTAVLPNPFVIAVRSTLDNVTAAREYSSTAPLHLHHSHFMLQRSHSIQAPLLQWEESINHILRK